MEILLIATHLVLTLSNLTLFVVILYTLRKKEAPSIPSPMFNNFKRKEPEETEEEKRYRILQENIENFDGTGKGQVKL